MRVHGKFTNCDCFFYVLDLFTDSNNCCSHKYVG